MGTSKVVLRPHAGQALLSMANTYPKLSDAVLEMIQNSIDANPANVYVEINLNTGRIAVRDDGDGVSTQTMETVFNQIGMSIKGQGKLGRFGRGIVAGLGKCSQFKLISCAKRQAGDGYHEWTFVTDKISNMAGDIDIPVRRIEKLMFSRKGKANTRVVNYVNWRTQMVFEGITEDRYISKLTASSLTEQVIENFGSVIRRKKINVWLYYTDKEGEYKECQIDPPAFMGRDLPTQIYTHPDVGNVEFKMYVTPLAMNGRKGRVMFGEAKDDFRISASQFFHSVDELLDQEVRQALTSGVFEGEILGQKIELHANRKHFVENDALIGFCLCLEKWYTEVGSKHYQETLSQNKERRYQKLGLRAMKVIEKYLDLPQFSEVMKRITMGTISTGHVDKTEIGTQKVRSMSIDGGAGKPRDESEQSDRDRSKPKSEKKGHIPKTVAGPEGKMRTMVRSNSTGIQLSVEALLGKSVVYEFDKTVGVLRINSRHPHFAACEKRDTWLMRYLETVAATALTLLLREDEESYMHQHQVAHDILDLLVLEITEGDVLSGRRATSGKGSNKEEN